MGFLLSKILVLLALAASGGALFAYWWFRRHYEDVTLEYARAREDWEAWRRRFEERLAARPQVDFTALTQHLDALQATVGDIPTPEHVELGPLEARLAELAQRIGELRAPDLSGTDRRLTAIEHALFPLQSRLDELTGAVRALRSGGVAAVAPVAALEGDEAAAEPAIETLGTFTVVEAPQEDGGESEQMSATEAEETSDTPEVTVREGTRNLLSHAGHGDPDDLTRIRGLPKVLERTLHNVGVFYFWQIAEWTPEDVEYVDSQLERFQGRIEQDAWVEQAGELAAEPDAAPRPARH